MEAAPVPEEDPEEAPDESQAIYYTIGNPHINNPNGGELNDPRDIATPGEW